MVEIIHTLIALFNNAAVFYAFCITSSYVILALVSINALSKHLKKNAFVDYRSILSSPFAPSISLIAPAFNEGLTIVENVRSLLSIQYPNYEVLIINDGSKDNSIEKLVSNYDLEIVRYAFKIQIPCKNIKNIYKSKNPAYQNLLVIDKENGGKADALNAGINISAGRFIACVDVDCIIEPDALLKMVKPFLEENEAQVIASGGVIRVANSCVIENGKLVEVRLPEQILPRFQVLEYIRAFLLGRMAWGDINGLLIISGAFGLFDKEIVIEAGGYDHNTVGEDMELVVRMRRLMEEKNKKYKVTFIPDPLCWTEAPDNYKILAKQRNRWTRGTIETLRTHKAMIFNPRYRLLGLLSFPYWLIFEWFAPILEFFGIIFLFFLTLLGYVNALFFFSLLAAIYSFAILFTAFAIFIDLKVFSQYNEKGAALRLFLTSLIEPIIFHPFNVWNAIKGNIDFLTGKKAWGQMVRTGFSKPPSKLT